jgi:hypothetical protein
MQTKSKDQDSLSETRSYEEVSPKSVTSKSASKSITSRSVASRTTTMNRASVEGAETESLKIVSLKQSKLFVSAKDQASITTFASMRKVKSDVGDGLNSRLHRPTIEFRDQPESPMMIILMIIQ